MKGLNNTYGSLGQVDSGRPQYLLLTYFISTLCIWELSDEVLNNYINMLFIMNTDQVHKFYCFNQILKMSLITLVYNQSDLLILLSQATCYVLIRPLSKNLYRRINRVVAELLWLELVWIIDWWAGVKVSKQFLVFCNVLLHYCCLQMQFIVHEGRVLIF